MIYFDSGATTLQKPPQVGRAMLQALEGMTSPGRGDYPASRRAAETAFRCRELAAELFDVPSPEQVVFTSNATHGLNIAIKSLVPPGGRVLISGYEHNAVTRPLRALGAVVDVAAAPLFQPQQVLQIFQSQLRPDTAAVICNHVSNVFGFIQPVEELAAFCRSRGVPLIVDASQSAGILPLSLRRWQAAFIAMPGHKGLYGPQGSGLLLVGDTAKPLLEGGTGSQSLLQDMPRELPDRLEAGTHSMPAIAGLFEGLRFVRRQGAERILEKELALAGQLCRGLEQMGLVRCFRDPVWQSQSGVVSFLLPGQDVEETARELAQAGFALRAGLHCAPLAHATAGTLESGTLRFSPSVFNTRREVEHFLWYFYKKFKK